MTTVLSRVDNEGGENRLGHWSSHQQGNYNPDNPQLCKQIMKSSPEVREAWRQLVAVDFAELFMTCEEEWFLKLGQLRQFLITQGERPNKRAKNVDETKLGTWLSCQLKNYNPNNP